MHRAYALVGLTPSERSLLESIFEFDGEADASLTQVREPKGADLLIVNGDDARVVERVRGQNPHALMVLVGQPPRSQNSAGLPVLRRPLDLAGVVAVFNTLDWPEPDRDSNLGQSGAKVVSTNVRGAASEPSTMPLTIPPPESLSMAPSVEVDAAAFAETTASAPLINADAAPIVASVRQPVSARHSWAVSEPAAIDTAQPESQVARPGTPKSEADVVPEGELPVDVIVVALNQGSREPTLPHGIRRLGYRVQTVGSAQEAMVALDRQSAQFVFLDQHSLGGELLPLARAVAARRSALDQPPYTVVVARGGNAFDRLRARLAGCGWMPVPIDRTRLVSYFARRGLQQRR